MTRFVTHILLLNITCYTPFVWRWR